MTLTHHSTTTSPPHVHLVTYNNTTVCMYRCTVDQLTDSIIQGLMSV